MLNAFGRKVSAWLSDAQPWTNVYGFARTLLALGAIVTLLANNTKDLFVKVAGMPEAPYCTGNLKFGLYCLVPNHNLELGRWISVALLLVIASGYRPRYTGVIHWFLALSFQLGASSLDGGDQVTTVITLLLLPVTLTDSRKWHWQKYVAPENDKFGELKRFFAATSLLLIRVQVAGIYFHAAAGKYATNEWSNGTALYYWLGHPLYGATSWLRPVLMPILTHSTVALMTWSVIVLEFSLMCGLFAAKKYWPILLVAGLSLHIGIAVAQGLVSFGFAMSAALVLYFRPTEKPFVFALANRVKDMITKRLRATPKPAASMDSVPQSAL